MVGREVVHWCYLTSGLELRLSSDVVNGRRSRPRIDGEETLCFVQELQLILCLYVMLQSFVLHNFHMRHTIKLCHLPFSQMSLSP